jgi:hypothetical protein
MMIPILVSFLLFIPDVSASSVLDSGKGGENEYTVQSKGDLYSWKVGHQGDVSIIKENKDNEGTLDNFRHAVNEIHTRE